jgi:hypothetical protein
MSHILKNLQKCTDVRPKEGTWQVLKFSDTPFILYQKIYKFISANAKLRPIAYVYPPFLQTQLITGGVSLPGDKSSEAC